MKHKYNRDVDPNAIDLMLKVPIEDWFKRLTISAHSPDLKPTRCYGSFKMPNIDWSPTKEGLILYFWFLINAPR